MEENSKEMDIFQKLKQANIRLDPDTTDDPEFKRLVLVPVVGLGESESTLNNPSSPVSKKMVPSQFKCKNDEGKPAMSMDKRRM